ncbi:MAG: HAMP domain-containing histidine kinase [Hyphomonadaceae bacterium]|nr:HAMP domain-containing histidine kinase [Hyphomonadaceae bacterium]
MKPVLPDAGLEDGGTGVHARPSLTIDAAQGRIVEANPAALAALGLDAASARLPVVLDRGMPALQHLKQRLAACARQLGPTETLTFWTPQGVRQFHCHVRRVPGGQGESQGGSQSLFVVRLVEGVAGKGLPAAANGAAPPAPKEVAATARLAHELRTPLSAVIAYAEVLKDEHFGPLGNQRYRDYARNIYDSARHALGVVDGMLASSPTPSGLPELAFTDLDPARIVESCLAVARPLADQAGLELVAEMAPRTPRIVADEVSLKQMLLNLLTNAIKFARRGDRVTVGVAYELGGPLRIAVADTGPGMREPPLALEGGRAGNGRCKVRNAGLGIGLPLTRALAEANGAALVIDSAPGRGTRVTIAFGKDRVVPV